jgi:membrane associated rhomboid family serine protease
MYGPGFGAFGYRLTPWVKRLMIANAIAFVVMWILIQAQVVRFDVFATYLGFNDSEFLTKPWTIVTYMFVHGGFLHILMNMLFLFFFGPPLEERWGGKEFIKYYAICGIGAALFNLVFSEGTIVGASGAVYGVMLAYALNWPNSPIWIYAIFPIKAKYLVMILGAISFFSAFGGAQDGIAHYAHLGGLVVGYVYLKKAWEIGARLEGLKKSLRKRRLSVVGGGAQAGPGARTRSKEAKKEAKMLDVVDKLLEKIDEHGIDSLTLEERKFLDDYAHMRRADHEVRH